MENELAILRIALKDSSSDDSPLRTKGKNSIPLDDESWVPSPKGSTTQCEFKGYSIQGLTSTEPWGSVLSCWEEPLASRSPAGSWQRWRSGGKSILWVTVGTQCMHTHHCCQLHYILVLHCTKTEVNCVFSNKATNTFFASFLLVYVIYKNANRGNMISLCSYH